MEWKKDQWTDLEGTRLANTLAVLKRLFPDFFSSVNRALTSAGGEVLCNRVTAAAVVLRFAVWCCGVCASRVSKTGAERQVA